MKRWTVLFGVAALTVGAASGAERSITLQDVTVLDNGRGQARVIFQMPEIAPGERIVVSNAQIAVALGGTPVERSLRLRVYPITREWNAGAVTWTSPWTRAGGDIDEEVYQPVDADLRRGHVILDVTGLVKEAVEEGRPTHGFLLTRDPDDGVGIPLEEMTRFQGISGARLSVSYQQVGPRPRGQH